MAENGNSTIPELWDTTVEATSYGQSELYQTHLFEQYKLLVDTADKTSARRNLANTFFLTLHTFLIGAAGFIYQNGPNIVSPWLNIFPLIAVMALCYVWYRLLLSYRQLNTAKFRVIGEYERKLPTSPFWLAEWKTLGEGKDPKKYRPLTDVEQIVPIIFAGLYVLAFVAAFF